MKPIPGLECVRPLDEFLVFEVTSPDSGKVYRIDKSLWFGSGACSCEDFACRIQVALGRGDWSGKTTCKHINLVDRFLACVGCTAGHSESGGKAMSRSDLLFRL